MQFSIEFLYIITEILLGEDVDVFIVTQCPNASTHPCQVMTLFF